MDPLSGTFASIGNTGRTILEFAADYFYNSKGGILGGRMIEVVSLDNKQSPNETQLQFRRAVSEEIQIIFQGNSSAVAKHSESNNFSTQSPEPRTRSFADQLLRC